MSGRTSGSHGIAIVGMACLFPGAPDLETYWRNIVNGVDSITDPPEEAWDAETFYDPDSSSNDRVYCKRGGHIGPLAFFDPLANGVMPKAVEGGEPDQWLALQVARHAFADAGYDEEIAERERTAVILGKGTYLNRGNISVVQHGRVVDQTLEILKALHPEYTDSDLEFLRFELKKDLPPFNSDTAPSLIPNVVAGRIANRLDLMGPNYTVDAACASSLVALEHAVRGLEEREFDLALVGGVHVATPVPTLMLFCQLGALSRQERLRPFDRSADGTLLGGGVGMVVLKRTEDALRDGQRIYATVRGVGISSDGRGLGVTAPRVEGEILALRRAYEKAGLSPRTVELIEAHGTGTPVGDQTEIRALHEVFGPPDGSFPGCAVGSVKSMISHLMPAAGIAGLIKAALALHHKTLPPTLNVDEPNPELGLDRTNFYINSETRPWIHGRAGSPRRAGVNAFGFGGINAHALVEEWTAGGNEKADSLMPWDSEVLLLSADTRAALIVRAEDLEQKLADGDDVRLEDLAFTLNTEWQPLESRLAIVASSIEDVREKLRRFCQRLRDPDCHRIQEVQGLFYFDGPAVISGKLAFLFPGEGSQYVNMLADLCLRLPEVRQSFDLIDRIFSEHKRKFVPSDFIFPRPAFSSDEWRATEERLWQMEGAFEAVQTANWALYSLLGELDVRPDVLLGHSTGEYTAMLAAGMIELDDARRVEKFAIELNDVYQQQTADEEGASGAALIAVAADTEAIWEACRPNNGEIHVAMNNCPHQTVIVGREEEIDSALERLQESGLIYERLPFDRPYHTPLFESCAKGLRQFLGQWITAPPRIPTYSCTTGAPFPDDVERIRAIAVDHWMRPVEFRKTIRTMYDDGVRLFVEVGPRGSLSAFVGDILRGQPHLAVPVNSSRRSGTRQLNTLVGLLAAHGVAIRPAALYAQRRLRKVDLEDLPSASSRTGGRAMKLETSWIPMRVTDEAASRLRGHAERTASPRHAELLEAKETGGGVPSGHSPPLPDVGADSDLERVMSAHYRTMERFLTLQQDVMETFLGSGGSVGPAEPRPRARAPAPASAETSVPTPDVPAAGNEGAGEYQRLVGEDNPDAGSPPLDSAEIERLLLEIVSDRTGYPPEMLGLDMDIEADLGIDSIKRVEFLGSFQQETGLLQGEDMEALAACKTLREVIDFLTKAAPPQDSATALGPGLSSPEKNPASALPFIDRVISMEAGKSVDAEREIHLDRDLFLRDHVLGRPRSLSEPDRSGLPLLPFTVSMEMLAETASVLMPEQRLVEMQDVTGHRWIAPEREFTTLRLHAEVDPDDPHRAVARIFDPANAGANPVFEGTMVFASDFPEPPIAEPLILSDETASEWLPERLYEDGMFHGPLFRGVESMDRNGSNGAEATLLTVPRRGLLAAPLNPEFLADPVLLDQPGQVVGLWTAENLDHGKIVFPFHLERLQIYGSAPKEGDRLRCTARISLIGDQLMSSDLEIVGTDERVWARLSGWKDRRFDVPGRFHQFLRRPMEVLLSEAWPVPDAGFETSESVEAYRLRPESFPAEIASAGGRIWVRTLARMVLSDSEASRLRSMSLPPDDELRWLLRQTVTKDAVRSHLARRHGMTVSPLDIEIVADESGRLRIDGPWLGEIEHPPRVSVSESQGVAVALVSAGRHIAGMGVDIGVTPARNEISLAEEEQALVGSLSGIDTQEWPLRISCAKEAVAKALGRDLSRAATELHVDHLDPGSGAVRLRSVRTDGSDPESSVPDDLLVAQTRREDNLIIATFFCKVPPRQ